LKTLCDLRIKVSSTDELNDPFELTPVFDAANCTLESCIEFLRRPDQIDYWYRKEGLPKGCDRKDLERAYLDDQSIQERAAKCLSNLEANVGQTAANFPQTMNQFFWFFFASKTRESILNWSHYACQHEGIVIEFETEQPPFSSLPRELHLNVDYKIEKASFCWSNDIEAVKRELLKVASRKWRDWGYEEEVRFAFPVTVCSGSKFVGLQPTTVRSVTFGCRHMKNGLTENLRSVLNELHTPRFKHVGIWEAAPKTKEFALDFILRRTELK